jgi:DNA-damage-inducible protein D
MSDHDSQNDRNDQNMDDDGNDEQGILPFDDGSAGRVIRKEWHEGRWFFSVIDVIAVLTDSHEPRFYWANMKRRIQDEGFTELLSKCQQLKMRSPLDGKKYKTDAADTETMLRITMSIPSPKAEPVRQWLAQVGAQRLDEVAAELDENQWRLLLRGEVAAQNTSLNAAASSHGLLTSRDFAIFHDWGYRGLYNGETARDIAARKGVTKGRILDYMESTELAANWFRITQTGDKLRHLADEGVTGQGIANQTHYHMGKAVRAFIVEQGNTLPEELPTPAQSIQQMERAEQERARARLQPSLFLSDTRDDGHGGAGGDDTGSGEPE